MKKRYSRPQIAAKLRQADVLVGQGKTVPEVCKEIEIGQQPNPRTCCQRKNEDRFGYASQ